jgi:hypothetical protein
VVAADAGHRVQRADPIHDFVWRRAVANEITERKQTVPGVLRRSGEHGLERIQIGVNIGEN